MRTIAPKIPELGRIRIGDQAVGSNGRGRPNKLSEFRFTSSDESLLHQIASVYGGDVRTWDNNLAPKDERGRPMQFELYAKTNTLDVVIPTLHAVSINYEVWKTGGCTLRCNGQFILKCSDKSREGMECTCTDDQEDTNRCPMVLRLNVILDAFAGLGVWRLDTHGYYAAAELQGTLEMLKYAGQDRQMIAAVLRLDQRKVKRDGQTRQFVVPVLSPKLTPRQILLGQQHQALQLTEAQKSLPEHVADLFGDDLPESSLQGLIVGDIVPQIEAMCHAHHCPLEAFWAYMERTYVMSRAEWGVAVYSDILAVLQKKPESTFEAITTYWAMIKQRDTLVARIDATIHEVGGDTIKYWARQTAIAGGVDPRHDQDIALLERLLANVQHHAETIREQKAQALAQSQELAEQTTTDDTNVLDETTPADDFPFDEPIE